MSESVTMKLLIVVISYEAAGFIERLLDRIPAAIAGVEPSILVADDHSADDSYELATRWAARHPDRSVSVVRHGRNLGYGGNQKACYRWAQDQGFDVAVLLHGDEQYPPEHIGLLVEPIAGGLDRVVFGSRMLPPRSALEGGMPWSRYLGNRSLTALLNHFSGQRLSEWFCGFRAYDVQLLAEIGVDDLPDDFHFDIAIMQRMLLARATIREVPIPTRYADEVSRVPLTRTGLLAARSALSHRAAHQRRRAEGSRATDPFPARHRGSQLVSREP